MTNNIDGKEQLDEKRCKWNYSVSWLALSLSSVPCLQDAEFGWMGQDYELSLMWIQLIKQDWKQACQFWEQNNVNSVIGYNDKRQGMLLVLFDIVK